MPVPEPSGDFHIHPLPPAGNLKRTHPLRVSFHHDHGSTATPAEDTGQGKDSNFTTFHHDHLSTATSSEDTDQGINSNFTRGHANRQTTPNIDAHINRSQIVPTRSQSHQHLGLIDANGRIRHYCPFHGAVKPHVHKVALLHASHLGHEDGHEDSSLSSSSTFSSTSSASSDGGESEDRSKNYEEIILKPQRSKNEKPPRRPARPQRKGCWQWKPYQHAMLISCYALLLVLAVLVGVVVSQGHRLSSRRRQPVPAGGVQIRRPNAASGLPQGPPPRIGGRPGGARRRRPQAAVPVPPPPPPTTTPTPTTTTELPLYDYEYDFEYFDSQSASVPAPRPPPAASTTFQPLPPPTSRPVQAVRQQTFSRPADRQTVSHPVDRQTFRTASSPPRRQGVSLANIDQDFTLKNEDERRGHKEPTVQIARAWSHQNPDGTFTWGYINTDGSYKNETKGIDCVVRGSYGYIDEATGQEIDVPYATGNPCNPDEPVVDYVDYDVQGFLANVRSGSGSPVQDPAPAQRRPQQQQFFDSAGSVRNRNF